MSNIEHLRFPIGKYTPPAVISENQRIAWIEAISALPKQVRLQVASMSFDQLQTPYRPGGWTAYQLVHHRADSHMNSLIRFKLALTEDHPPIKPYLEHLWAPLADTVNAPLESSMSILDGVHARLTILLKSMTEEQFARTYFHPEAQESVRLDVVLGSYAWHGAHHLAHMQLIH